MRNKLLVIVLSLTFMTGVSSNNKSATKPTTTKVKNVVGSNNWVKTTSKTISSKATNLDPEVLKVSLNAYAKAKSQGITKTPMLTIVDYSKPSKDRRLWVIDMRKLNVVFNTWVAHGKNSGAAKATSFSNKPQSKKSSLGVFITDAPYRGIHGYSLRIKGLEKNINNNAYNRAIVVHGSKYVSQGFAKSRGMMGRSWGCFAVDQKVIKPLVNTIKEKSIIVAYYPDKNWLSKSSYVKT